MPDTVVVRFDITNPRAERLIDTRAGEQITNVTETTRDAVREVILDGYESGRGPNDIALDIVGRINRVTGRREGGVIGLTGPQTRAAVALRRRLLSGLPEEMRKVLNMGLRDQRFDGTIRKAIDGAITLSAEQVDKMYRQYINNALRFRGEMIARTETGQAVLEAAHEAFQQTLEKTGYDDDAVTKVWRTASDRKVRDSHAALDGQEVNGLGGVFVSPETGAEFLYPMDDSLGAGPEEIINCRCLCEYNIDFSRGVRAEPEPEPEAEPRQRRRTIRRTGPGRAGAVSAGALIALGIATAIRSRPAQAAPLEDEEDILELSDEEADVIDQLADLGAEEELDPIDEIMQRLDSGASLLDLSEPEADMLTASIAMLDALQLSRLRQKANEVMNDNPDFFGVPTYIVNLIVAILNA
jgi:hypothetical protein